MRIPNLVRMTVAEKTSSNLKEVLPTLIAQSLKCPNLLLNIFRSIDPRVA